MWEDLTLTHLFILIWYLYSSHSGPLYILILLPGCSSLPFADLNSEPFPQRSLPCPRWLSSIILLQPLISLCAWFEVCPKIGAIPLSWPHFYPFNKNEMLRQKPVKKISHILVSAIKSSVKLFLNITCTAVCLKVVLILEHVFGWWEEAVKRKEVSVNKDWCRADGPGVLALFYNLLNGTDFLNPGLEQNLYNFTLTSKCETHTIIPE